MLPIGIAYSFTAEMWAYKGPNAWNFVSLPLSLAKEIRENLKSEEEGWGRLKATAQTGNSTWKSAIWFDTKMNTYLLPIKAEIRKKENLELGQKLKLTIWV